MKQKLLLLLIIIFLYPFMLEAEEITLTVDEAVAIALRDNRDILIKAEELKEAKAKLAEAEGGLFPTLNFTGTWSRTRGYYAKDINQTTTQTTLKQYLYRGGETINTIKYNHYKLEVSQALLDKTKLDTIAEVKNAFYTFLLANGLSQLNQAIVENTRQHLDLLKARYKNGQASESEILNIEASLKNVEQAYTIALNQVEATNSLLNNLLYLDKEVRIKPQGELDYSPLELAYSEAFLKAMAMRPEIKQYEAQIQADKQSIEIAKANNRPNIYASWDYYSRSTTSLTFSPSKGWQHYNIIGLTFSWPIFDGWITRAKVEQAIADLKETQLLKEKTIRDISLELKNAYLALKNALASIGSTESEAKLYQDNQASVRQKYQAGLASQLDLDDAGLKYAVATFNQQQATYDYLIAKISFDQATGGGI